MLKTVYRSSRRDKHNCQRRDSNLDPLTLQSDALTTQLLRPGTSVYKEGTKINTEMNERPLQNIGTHWNIWHR